DLESAPLGDNDAGTPFAEEVLEEIERGHVPELAVEDDGVGLDETCGSRDGLAVEVDHVHTVVAQHRDPIAAIDAPHIHHRHLGGQHRCAGVGTLPCAWRSLPEHRQEPRLCRRQTLHICCGDIAIAITVEVTGQYGPNALGRLELDGLERSLCPANAGQRRHQNGSSQQWSQETKEHRCDRARVKSVATGAWCSIMWMERAAVARTAGMDAGFPRSSANRPRTVANGGRQRRLWWTATTADAA